jgi:Transposase, Mutator family
MRAVYGEHEVPLQSYEYFADRDPLQRVVLERMLAGVSTRRYRRTQEPVGEQIETRERSTSKSAVSRTFVERTRQALGELMGRQLSDLRLAVMMLSKALRKGVRSVFGEAPVQRCLWHTERNVLGHIPERDRPPIKARMRRAWRDTDDARALEQLQALAADLEHTHPGAAGSLREGMEETLTVIRLGIKGRLRRTLESTNPCESMIDTVRTTQRNVKPGPPGRWACAGRPPGCSKPNSSSARSSATPSSRSSPSRSSADFTFTSPPLPRPRRPRSPSLCNDHTRTVVTEVPRQPGQPHQGAGSA